MHEDARAGERPEELGHAHRHGPGMPVLEHASGDEPDVVLLVGRFGRRLVGDSDDLGAPVGLAVEVDALARPYERIESLAVAPFGLLAVDDWPAQPANLVIGVEWREVVAVTAAEP